MIEIRKTTLDDIVSMKDRLLDCDVVSLKEELGLTPFQSLAWAQEQSSHCSTVLNDGRPMLIFGLVPSPVNDGACGWMLVTKDMASMKLTFLRKSKEVIRDMLDIYPVIYNRIAAKHDRVIAWLKWCGAIVTPPEPDPSSGKLYSKYFLRRSPHV